LITTDSGGIQKETFFHRVPCDTLSDETEWVELVEAGWIRLVPPAREEVILSALRESRSLLGYDIKPYGIGDATTKIARSLAASG
jgi:UDP-GlcNAc3NAcA epimerase